jgi:long-chain-fatty-acid--CoA ligase ACSBG|tara:strand:+ start:249 stop:938 length:690 start_codon:yes stop_codon:yes gene_type:complete
MVSYLPLSHIAGLQSDLVGTMLAGSTIFFARPDALQGTLTASIQWAKPTLFFTVPRVWEKFEDALKAAGKAAPAIAQKLSGWAKGHGYKKVMDGTKGIEPGFMYGVANAIVLTKIKKALGFEECRLFFYGAAPLKQSSVEYFASIDMPLMNMYGLSETTGSATVNSPNDFSLDHCGEMLAGTHIKITEQDAEGKGEIRIAGRHIMMGYLKNEKATLEVIDEDGYFRTGD